MTQAGSLAGAAVTFEDVTVVLGDNLILDHVTASVPHGSTTAIVGPNGAGKTTLLLALLKQIPYEGRIRMEGKTGGRMPRIGYVPQRFQFDRGMPLTVLEFMVMGHQRMPLWFGVRRRSRERARELLASVRAEGLESRSSGSALGGRTPTRASRPCARRGSRNSRSGRTDGGGGFPGGIYLL